MKKIILSVLGILLIGGGAFAGKIAIDRPNDAQQFVNNALANSLSIKSAKSSALIQITTDADTMGNGQIALTLDGVTTNATDYLPTLDYQINLDFAVNFLGQAISGKASGEIMIVDEVFYGRLAEVTLEGSEAMGLSTETIDPYVGKWYALSFAKLKAADPQIAAVFEEQKTQQLAMRETLKNLFTTNDILLVKKMPIDLSDIQPVEVTLNTDLLMSDEFLAEIGKLFASANLPEGTENPFKLDDTQKAELKTALEDIKSKISTSITLQIGRDDDILRGYNAVVSFNLADLGAPQLTTGTASIVLNSQASEINQPQTVTAPTDFEEVDPLQFVPVPNEEEVVLDENGLPIEPEPTDLPFETETSDINNSTTLKNQTGEIDDSSMSELQKANEAAMKALGTAPTTVE